MKKVLTNGIFDILHIGHIRLLQHCKSLGDHLTVLVNTDDSVMRLKGETRPINPLHERVEMLHALECVDEVLPFGMECEGDSPRFMVAELQPDIYVKGGDYKKQQLRTTPVVEAYGGEVVIFPLVEGKSTTDIIERVVGYGVVTSPNS
jgi:rfaE bifunctional protein nucleotidyltransferase chain/domain